MLFYCFGLFYRLSRSFLLLSALFKPFLEHGAASVPRTSVAKLLVDREHAHVLLHSCLLVAEGVDVKLEVVKSVCAKTNKLSIYHMSRFPRSRFLLIVTSLN